MTTNTRSEFSYYDNPIPLRNGGTGIAVNTGSTVDDDETALTQLRKLIRAPYVVGTIVSSQDINNVVMPQMVWCTAPTIAYNYPTTTPGTLIVMAGALNSSVWRGIIQMYITNTSSQTTSDEPSVYIRSKNGHYTSYNWTAWKELGSGGGSVTYPITVDKGGTNATDASTARTNLGITPANIGAALETHTHTSSDITDTIPIASGGTGKTSLTALLKMLEVNSETITSAIAPRVGAFLGLANQSGADADDCLPYGGYAYCASCTTALNYPVSGRGYLMQYGKSTDNYACQQFFTAASATGQANLYVRFRYNDTWTDWTLTTPTSGDNVGF